MRIYKTFIKPILFQIPAERAHNLAKVLFKIGVLWEIFEVWVEGTHETYGTKKKWAYNTASDIFVEVAAAAWMVW